MTNTLEQLQNPQEFSQRHIGPDQKETEFMLKELGLNSLEELLIETVPNKIRLAIINNYYP